jgi:hypothetical protein
MLLEYNKLLTVVNNYEKSHLYAEIEYIVRKIIYILY